MRDKQLPLKNVTWRLHLPLILIWHSSDGPVAKPSCKVDWDVQSLAESKNFITKKKKRRMNIEEQILNRDITHFMYLE